MESFNYHRPRTLAEALELLRNPEARLLAGGHTLLPSMKQQLATPEALIDLVDLQELRGIQASVQQLRIGALTPHAEVAASAEVKSTIPGLAGLAGQIGDQQVRNLGTLGGSVANNDPAADYPAGLLGLGAVVVTDRREIQADDFFVDLFETALDEGEIITRVDFPLVDAAAYSKFPNPASRYALVGVFISRKGSAVRVAVTGAAPCVYRATNFEAALSEDFSVNAIKDLSQAADHLNYDMHASADYRAHLVKVMIRRTVERLS